MKERMKQANMHTKLVDAPGTKSVKRWKHVILCTN